MYLCLLSFNTAAAVMHLKCWFILYITIRWINIIWSHSRLSKRTTLAPTPPLTRLQTNTRGSEFLNPVYSLLHRQQGSVRSPYWRPRGRAPRPSGSSTSIWSSECFFKMGERGSDTPSPQPPLAFMLIKNGVCFQLSWHNLCIKMLEVYLPYLESWMTVIIGFVISNIVVAIWLYCVTITVFKSL